MKLLVVGDPHATVEELQDCQRLIDYIENTAREQGVDEILFLGDLYHTHSVLHLEVMAFWTRALEQLTAINKGKLLVKVLVGNHDMPGNEGSSSHALMAQKHIENVHVYDIPQSANGVAYIPYMADANKWLEAAGTMPDCKTLICHQTFNGSYYENGFYAPDGIDPTLVPQPQVLSGHIHAPQSFGKIWYPGAPRWRTLSDANTERAIWVVELDPEGTIVKSEPFSTGGVCREIRHIGVVDAGITPVKSAYDLAAGITGPIDFTPEGNLKPGIDWRIDIRGNLTFIEEAKAVLQGPGVRVRTLSTEAVPVSVRESEGIQKAFSKWLGVFQSRYNTPPETLKRMVDERLSWT